MTVSVLSIFASTLSFILVGVAFGGPMTFTHVNPDCQYCDWIAAEGEITSNTVQVFKEFAKSTDLPERLVINGSGKDQSGAIALAREFRARLLQVEIGDTVESAGAPSTIAPGYCSGACALAFLGGIRRSLTGETPKLGDDPSVRLIWEKPAAEAISVNLGNDVFAPGDRVDAQIAVGELVGFLIDMEVSLDLYERLSSSSGLATTLSNDELIRYGVIQVSTDIPSIELDYDITSGKLVLRATSILGRGGIEIYCDTSELVVRRTFFVAREMAGDIEGCTIYSCISLSFLEHPQNKLFLVTAEDLNNNSFPAIFRGVYLEDALPNGAARLQSNIVGLTEDRRVFPAFEFGVPKLALQSLRASRGVAFLPQNFRPESIEYTSTLAFDFWGVQDYRFWDLIASECQ